jgi:hypothetical protein
MNLTLTREQADELQGVLQVALRELTHEIAATDNAGFRAALVARRARLAELNETLCRQLLVPATFDDGGDALLRELARPGD